MKKTITILLVIIMVFSLTACGGDDTSDPNLGRYEGYQVDILGWEPIEEMFSEGESYIELKSGGKGTFCVNGDSVTVKWTLEGESLTLTADGQTSNCTLKDGVIATDFFGSGINMTFVKDGVSPPESLQPVTPTAEPEAEPSGLRQWWNGDWYGWWITTNGQGWLAGINLNGQFWDCCARMDVTAEGEGTLVMWDEDLPIDNPLAEIVFTVSEDSGSGDMGAAISESGHFMDMEIEHADIIIDPSLCDYENFMILDLWYEDEEGSSTIEVYLRPWGQDWSDVTDPNHTMAYEDMLPRYYYDWYLPAIEAGAEMPDAVGGDTETSVAAEVPDEEMEAQPLNPGAAEGLVPIGYEEILGVVLPDGFSYNDGWCCYSDSAYTVALWLSDTATYAEQSNMESILGQYPNARQETIGGYTVYVAEDPEAFEGATTYYFVELNGVGGFYGCMVKVSSTKNDMAATQTDAIRAMIASIQAVA